MVKLETTFILISKAVYINSDSYSTLYSSLNIVRAIKSWRMRWAGHVARMGEKRGVYRVLVGKP